MLSFEKPAFSEYFLINSGKAFQVSSVICVTLSPVALLTEERIGGSIILSYVRLANGVLIVNVMRIAAINPANSITTRTKPRLAELKATAAMIAITIRSSK